MHERVKFCSMKPVFLACQDFIRTDSEPLSANSRTSTKYKPISQALVSFSTHLTRSLCHEPLNYLIHYPEILTVPLSLDISHHSPTNYPAFIFPHSSYHWSTRSLPHLHMLHN